MADSRHQSQRMQRETSARTGITEAGTRQRGNAIRGLAALKREREMGKAMWLRDIDKTQRDRKEPRLL